MQRSKFAFHIPPTVSEVGEFGELRWIGIDLIVHIEIIQDGSFKSEDMAIRLENS